MISFFLFVYLFTFVTSKTFHPNQHLPVQKFQPPLRYRPYEYYPSVPNSVPTIPFYQPSPTKEGITEGPTQEQISDLERQYQQWQIAVSNGQQPGVVWISAPQYSYYPPPSGSPPNYPPPPYYPPSPYPPPYPLPAPQSNSSQPEIQEINPTQSRETVNPTNPTKPNPPQPTPVDYTTPSEIITLSPVETPSTSPPSSESTTTPSPTTYSPTTPSTTYSPTTPSSTYSPTTPSSTYSPPTSSSTYSPTTPSSTYSPTTEGSTLPPVENSTFITITTPKENVTTTTESTTNATTEISSTEYTTPSVSGTTQNSTSVETTTTPQNTTSNSTNPLLKFCKKPRGQFPGRECSKFVNCWDDTAIEQGCPSGLYFNANKSYCDYPENVECSGVEGITSTESSSNSSSSSPSNTTSSKCPSSYGTYRNSSNCAAFYVCVAGEPVDFYCPPGTNYNDELKVCDYPYRVNCSGIPSYPIPEESVTTIATETTPSNTTSNSTTPSNTTTPYTTESPVNVTTPSNVTSSPNTTTSYPNTNSSSPYTTSSSNTTASYTTTESVNATTETISTLPPPQVTEEPIPSFPPPTVDPIALYNFNLKKLPESVVNTGVRCYHSNIFRLTPDCSSVTICQDGSTYIVNCAHGTSFDAYSEKCVPSFRARC